MDEDVYEEVFTEFFGVKKMQASLGQAISPIATIEGKIQSRIAKFLGLKETLIGLTKNPVLTIQSAAQTLLNKQYELEKQLQDNLRTIDKIKSTGAWTFSDVVNLSVYAYAMETQINTTDKLAEQTSITTAAVSSSLFSTTNIAIGMGALLIVYLLLRR